MATILERSLQEDPETGCTPGEHFEECRQSYFLKQQNQILQQQKSAPVSENTASNTELEKLRGQIEQQKTEIESLKIQQTTTPSFNNSPISVSPYLFAGIGIVIGLVVGIVLVKLLKSRK